MAKYIFNCPHCGESIDADDSFCGMEAECPHCACKIIVPERHKVVLKKANQAGGLFLRFCTGLKCMTRREFWTLKHSVIVGQSVIVVLLFIAVVFLLSGKGNDDEKRDVVSKEITKIVPQTEEVARTEKKDQQSVRPIANVVSAETPSGKLLMYAELGETSFVEKVLKENPTLDVNRPRAEGNKTALYLACEKGYSDIVKLLLEREADAMICDDARASRENSMKYSALTVAARNGHVEVVKLLLSSSIDKESRDDRNRTALFAAVANNKPKVVQCLCEAKANVDVYGVNKFTPLTVAAGWGYVEVIKVLLKNGNGVDLEMRDGKYNSTPLYYAAEKNHPEVVEILCKAGAKVNVYGGVDLSYTPLTIAASEGYSEVVKSLLKYGKGIDLEMRDRGHYNSTPLYYAAEKNHPEVVEILCKAGAKVNVYGGVDLSYTPLTIAASEGYSEVVKSLLKYGKGIDLEMRDRGHYKATPLYHAVLKNQVETVEVLCDAGADLNADAGPYYKTIINLASNQGNEDAVRVLQEYQGTGKDTECQVGNYTWTYSAQRGKATVKGVSPKTGNIVIPQKLGKYVVTAIGEDAFKNCKGLTSVEMPSTVTSIGKFAFSGCESLAKVEIPTSVKSVEGGTFQECKSLTSVTMPEGVTNIGYHAFSDCGKLASVTIPPSVTAIGNDAFSGCSGLTSVRIPGNVKRIEEAAFKNCKGLTTLELSKGVTNIAKEVFIGCESLTSVTLPDSVVGIGARAFSGCANLKRVTIPDGVSSVGFSAFEDCSNLASVTLGNGVKIEARAFRGCRKLFKNDFMILGDRLCGYTGSDRDVTIPKGVTSIEGGAFYDCKNLVSVKIPSSVIAIRGGAFESCENLSSVSIPSSVVCIGDLAFKDCSGLTAVTIPTGVTSIGDFAFAGCSGLTSVTIPNSVTNIGVWAFSGCHFKKVKIPDSVISIGKDAFGYCVYLKDVSMPEAFADAISSVFPNCPDLSKMIDMRKVDMRKNWDSAECFREKAERGDARAQYYMGMWCFEVDKDINTAIEWLGKSAEQGHAGSQFELGQCCFMAWGAANGSNSKYIRVAKKMWNKAVEQGHRDARQMLIMSAGVRDDQ